MGKTLWIIHILHLPLATRWHHSCDIFVYIINSPNYTYLLLKLYISIILSMTIYRSRQWYRRRSLIYSQPINHIQQETLQPLRFHYLSLTLCFLCHGSESGISHMKQYSFAESVTFFLRYHHAKIAIAAVFAEIQNPTRYATSVPFLQALPGLFYLSFILHIREIYVKCHHRRRTYMRHDCCLRIKCSYFKDE